MKKITGFLKIAACAAAGIMAMTGCTNYSKMLEEEPQEYVSLAAENTAEAIVADSFSDEYKLIEEAVNDGSFLLEFEVEGIKFSAEGYANEKDQIVSQLYTLTGSKGTSAKVYAFMENNIIKFGTIGNSGTHIYSLDIKNLENKLASSIFHPDSGSYYAISESDYEMLLEYAAQIDAAIKGENKNDDDDKYSDFEDIINDCLEKYPPVTSEKVDTTINGETVSANIVQYDIPKEGLREIAALLVDEMLKQQSVIATQSSYSNEDVKAEMLSELDKLDDYSLQLVYYINSKTNQLMESDARLSWAEKPEPESNSEDGYDYVMSYNTNAKYDVSASIIYGADPASAEKQSVRIDFNIDYYDDDSFLTDTSGSLIADITKSETKTEVHITLSADGETMDLATITAEKNGDDYSVTVNIPEADITAGMTGTLKQDKDSFTMTIDRLFLNYSSTEMAYLPKAVLTVKKGGEMLDLDAEKDFFDITEDELDALVENVEADFEAVFEEITESSDL